MVAIVSSITGNPRKGVILDTPSRTITSRVPHEFSLVIDEASSALGMTKSEFIRRSIRSVYEAVMAAMQASVEDVGSVQAEVSIAEGIETF